MKYANFIITRAWSLLILLSEFMRHVYLLCIKVNKPYHILISTVNTEFDEHFVAISPLSYKLFTEYLHHPEATKNAFTPDGWFRSGDLGMVNENSEIIVLDRIKLVIKPGHLEPVSLPTMLNNKTLFEMHSYQPCSSRGNLYVTPFPLLLTIHCSSSGLSCPSRGRTYVTPFPLLLTIHCSSSGLSCPSRGHAYFTPRGLHCLCCRSPPSGVGGSSEGLRHPGRSFCYKTWSAQTCWTETSFQ